jgi:sulfite reductase alpha subunit-like flavoprotein
LIFASRIFSSLNSRRSSNKMPTSVKAAIAHAVESQGGYTADKAKKYVHDMAKEGRLIEECWS